MSGFISDLLVGLPVPDEGDLGSEHVSSMVKGLKEAMQRLNTELEFVQNLRIAREKKYWDNVTGLPLVAWRVEQARKEEIEFFRKQGVYEKVWRTTCYGRTGKAPVKVRWVDVNKGDEQNPEYRSRLVAMEFKTDSSAEWFSGTPPT